MFAIVVERGDKETKCCKNATVNEFQETSIHPLGGICDPFCLVRGWHFIRPPFVPSNSNLFLLFFVPLHSKKG